MNELAVRTMDDVERAATSMAKSGYFQDSREMAQAVVKILAGQEMGFGPFSSMTGIYIIQGRPSIGANLMAAAVKRSGRYNYQVTEMSETACRIEFTEMGKPTGVSTFTLEDARKAGTKNLDRYARNMLFARAMSNGVRWFCPDVLGGSAVYTPEELGANVNEEGEVIEAQFTPQTAAPVHTEKRAEYVTEPVTNAQPDNKPEPTDWPTDFINLLATEFSIPAPRVKATMQYCKLPKISDYAELSGWMSHYKTARGEDKSTAEAAEIANSFNK